MIRSYRSWPGYLFDRLRGNSRRISVVGGACGPTAVFSVRSRKPRRARGCLALRFRLSALARAMSLSAVVVLVFAVALGLYKDSGRRKR